MVQKRFQEHLRTTGITKRATPHTLRHSYATHFIENGGTVLDLKEALGHSHLDTVLVYLHCAKDRIARGSSPLDVLYGAMRAPVPAKAEGTQETAVVQPPVTTGTPGQPGQPVPPVYGF